MMEEPPQLLLNDVLFQSEETEGKDEEDLGHEDIDASEGSGQSKNKFDLKNFLRGIFCFLCLRGNGEEKEKKESWTKELSKKTLKTKQVVHPVIKRKMNANYIRTTKYTFLTFIPFCLLQQLLKLSNLYFIALMCFSLIPGVSPIFPLTSITPVVYLLGVALIKEAIEDLARYRADLKANGNYVEIYDTKTKKFVSKKTSAITPGDIVRLEQDKEVPCDMAILYAPKKESSCFITTANLDGETNLKKRQGVYIFRGETSSREESRFIRRLLKHKYRIEMEENTENLDQMKGKIELEDFEIVRTPTNISGENVSVTKDIEMSEFKIGSLEKIDWEKKRRRNDDDDEMSSDQRTPSILQLIDEKINKRLHHNRSGDEDSYSENDEEEEEEINEEEEEEEDVTESSSEEIDHQISSSGQDDDDETTSQKEEEEGSTNEENEEGGQEVSISFTKSSSADYDTEDDTDQISSSKETKSEEKSENEHTKNFEEIHIDENSSDSSPSDISQLEEPENINEIDQKLPMYHTDAFTIKNVLLRGVYLRITPYVLGIATYTGRQTKLFKNLKKSKTKWGILDVKMNRRIFSLLILQQVCVILGIILSYYYQKTVSQKSWHLKNIKGVDSTPWYFPITNWMTFVMLLEVFIPMSLFVTIQVIISLQAFFMQYTIQHDGKKMSVKTSNLNFDLAHIDIVFSDKTGTLTENKMDYSKAFIFDEVFTKEMNISDTIRKEFDLSYMSSSSSNEEKKKNNDNLVMSLRSFRNLIRMKKEYLDLFLLNLILNNTVTPHRNEETGELIKYDGPSSDEVALVSQCAHESEYIIKEKLSDRVICEVRGEEIVFKILDVIPFNSKRKRSSIIVQRISGSGQDDNDEKYDYRKNKYPILLFCKGADNELLNRSINTTSIPLRNKIIETVDRFSYDGLRTLVLGYKVVTPSQYEDFHRRWKFAQSQIQDQARAMEDVADPMERGLGLLGTTAIADELQEGVPEAVAFLRNAGLQVWILTGDKTETAINIGYQSAVMEKGVHAEIRLTSRGVGSYKGNSVVLKNRMLRLVKYFENPGQYLRKRNLRVFKDEEMEESESEDQKNMIYDPKLPEKYVMIVDNGSLDDIMSSRALKNVFIRIIKYCDSVLCCRVTPIQKAIVTGIVQKHLKKRGVAIGDGANDVSMIQKAYVGVGIMGREGSQAQRASDFALPKFKYIVDLLAVQGRYSYLRSSDCVLVSLYKNFMYAWTSYFYLFFNLFTGQILFDSWIFQTYNTFYHLLPPLLYGVLEKDLPEHLIKRCPSLYPSLRKHDPFFNRTRLFYWYGVSIYQSMVHFWSTFLVCTRSNLLGGYESTEDIFMMGHVIMTGMMVTMFMTYAMHTKSWTVLHVPSYAISFLLYLIFITIDSSYRTFLGISEFYYVSIKSYDSHFFYVLLFFNVVASVGPVFVLRYVIQQFFPTEAQIILSLGRKNVMLMENDEIREIIKPVKEKVEMARKRRRMEKRNLRREEKQGRKRKKENRKEIIRN